MGKAIQTSLRDLGGGHRLNCEVFYNDGHIGGRRGYYLRVQAEEVDGVYVLSRIHGGASRRLMLEATQRFSAKRLAVLAAGAEALPEFAGMVAAGEAYVAAQKAGAS